MNVMFMLHEIYNIKVKYIKYLSILKKHIGNIVDIIYYIME